MAPTDDNYAEKGLLSPNSSSSQQDSFDRSSPRPIFVKSSRTPSILHNACCILLGIVIALAALSISSSTSLRAVKAVKLDLGLEPALVPGEEPAINGYWCGTTPAEARSRGCRFDVILYSWIHPLCHDEQLQEAYMTQRESEWYRERGGGNGEKVSQAEAAAGEIETLWLPWSFHYHHCQFVLKMVTRILRNTSMGIPGQMLEYYHTDHCINVLEGMEHGPRVDISTILSLNYSTCYSRV
ncbi:MAG: hypothetical protein MMC23_003260 [Stictis urceolatum]|nr:hypothetical protein [Stictis urceolata]